MGTRPGRPRAQAWRLAAYRFGQAVVPKLPGRVLLAAASALAPAHWALDAPARRGVRANLALLLGRPVGAGEPSVREVFRNFWLQVIECLRWPDPSRLDVAVEGAAHVEAARRPGRGLVLLTCHLGNWELGAAAAASRLGASVATVAQPHPDVRIDRLYVRRRQRWGVHTIPLGARAPWRSLEHLRGGGVLGLLADGRFGSRQLRVRLGGKRIALAEGPAHLSRRSGAPVIPSVMVRTAPWRFRLVLERPVWPQDPNGRRRSPAELTEAYAGLLAPYLVRHATQWVLLEPAADGGGAWGGVGLPGRGAI